MEKKGNMISFLLHHSRLTANLDTTFFLYFLRRPHTPSSTYCPLYTSLSSATSPSSTLVSFPAAYRFTPISHDTCSGAAPPRNVSHLSPFSRTGKLDTQSVALLC